MALLERRASSLSGSLTFSGLEALSMPSSLSPSFSSTMEQMLLEGDSVQRSSSSEGLKRLLSQGLSSLLVRPHAMNHGQRQRNLSCKSRLNY